MRFSGKMQLELSRNAKRGGFWLTDRKTGACVGFAVRGFYVELIIVYVPEKRRGKGLGTKILKAGINYLSQTYPDKPLTLLCMHLPGVENISVQELQKWYERHGFRVLPGQAKDAVEISMVHDPDGILIKSIIHPELTSEQVCRP